MMASNYGLSQSDRLEDQTTSTNQTWCRDDSDSIFHVSENFPSCFPSSIQDMGQLNFSQIEGREAFSQQFDAVEGGFGESAADGMFAVLVKAPPRCMSRRDVLANTLT
jgi:hypothetical protein